MSKEYRIIKGTSYDARTPVEVVNWLETSRERRQRIRLFYGNTETGEAWPEENDVIGYIGRSNGVVKIPIILHNSRSMGGPGVLDHCIVGIGTITDQGWRGSRFRMVYRHQKFHTGEWEAKAEPTDLHPIRWVVRRNGETHAVFHKANCKRPYERALNYIEFMRGERMVP